MVLPTFNEAENLPVLVNKILSLEGQDISLLIVDDNSPDGTGEIADRLSEEHPESVHVMHRQGKQGLASAYIQGFKHALTIDGIEAIGMMDSDFSHDPAKLPEMIAAMEDADLVIGSRYVEGGSVDQEWPAWRKFLSAFGNFYARTILNLKTQDVTTGYRLWRREKMLSFPLDAVLSTGYIFLVEMAYLATRLGFRIVEVPIYFADRKVGDFQDEYLRIQLEAAFRVWQVRFAHRNRF